MNQQDRDATPVAGMALDESSSDPLRCVQCGCLLQGSAWYLSAKGLRCVFCGKPLDGPAIDRARNERKADWALRKPPIGWWPPEWLDDASRAGLSRPPISWSTGPSQPSYLFVAYHVPSSTPFERQLAGQLSPPEAAVAAASALVKAGQRRPADMADEAWQGSVERIWGELSAEQRQDPDAIVRAVRARKLRDEWATGIRNGRAWVEQLIADEMADEEIVDEVLGRPDGRDRPVDVDRELYYDDPLGRRRLLGRVGELRSGLAERTRQRPGPDPMTTLAEVEATREILSGAGQPSGERSIAKWLGVSRDAVRYAQGKDRR